MKEKDYQWKFKLNNKPADTPAREGDPRVKYFCSEIQQLLDIVELLYNDEIVRVDSFRFIGEETVYHLFEKTVNPSDEQDSHDEEST